MKLGDMVEEVVLQAGRLARDAVRIVARHPRFAAVLVAGVGVSSPLTGAVGASPLAGSSWGDWLRGAALVLLALALHLLLRATVRKAGDRDDGMMGDRDDGFSFEATAEAPWVKQPIAVEIYDEAYWRLGGPGRPELVAVQRRRIRWSGLELPPEPGDMPWPEKGFGVEPPV
jgi:membrane protein implicated in regulation of membrane protease activity